MTEKIVGRQYVVVKETGTKEFPVGATVKFVYDDGTNIPWFVSNGIAECINMSHVKLLAETSDEIDAIESTTKHDNVNHPPHYNQGKYETIDVIEHIVNGYTADLAYPIGTVVKYLDRAPFKNNTLEDLKKAQWYLSRAIERMEGAE